MKYVLTLLFILSCSNLYADMDTLYDSVCAVNGGTGTVYAVTEDKIFIVTNAHCVLLDDLKTENESHTVYFFHTGTKSPAFDAKVLQLRCDAYYQFKSYIFTKDIAIVTVLMKSVKRFYTVPKAFKIKLATTRPKAGALFYSVGRPAPKSNEEDTEVASWTSWPTGFKGRITDVTKNKVFIRPYPIPGRSGSLVMNSKDRLIGIITRTDGACMSHSIIASQMKDMNESAKDKKEQIASF